MRECANARMREFKKWSSDYTNNRSNSHSLKISANTFVKQLTPILMGAGFLLQIISIFINLNLGVRLVAQGCGLSDKKGSQRKIGNSQALWQQEQLSYRMRAILFALYIFLNIHPGSIKLNVGSVF